MATSVIVQISSCQSLSNKELRRLITWDFVLNQTTIPAVGLYFKRRKVRTIAQECSHLFKLMSPSLLWEHFSICVCAFSILMRRLIWFFFSNLHISCSLSKEFISTSLRKYKHSMTKLFVSLWYMYLQKWMEKIQQIMIHTHISNCMFSRRYCALKLKKKYRA